MARTDQLEALAHALDHARSDLDACADEEELEFLQLRVLDLEIAYHEHLVVLDEGARY